MADYEVETDLKVVSGKKSRHVKYEYKVVDGKTRDVLSIRRSKKGGATFNHAFYDLIYLAAKVDPYWMDRLVCHDDFPKIVSVMQRAYEHNRLFGWSPGQVRELYDYRKKLKKGEKS